MNRRDHAETDLGCAAYLVVKGFPLRGLHQCGHNRFAFLFDAAAGDAVSGYLNGDCVPARVLVEAQKDLKDRLYAEKRNGDSSEHTSHR